MRQESVSEPAEEDPQENEKDRDRWPENRKIMGLHRLKRKGLRQNPKASSSKQWAIGKLDPCSTPKLGFKSIVSGCILFEFPKDFSDLPNDPENTRSSAIFQFSAERLFLDAAFNVPPVMFGIYREKPSNSPEEMFTNLAIHKDLPWLPFRASASTVAQLRQRAQSTATSSASASFPPWWQCTPKAIVLEEVVEAMVTRLPRMGMF